MTAGVKTNRGPHVDAAFNSGMIYVPHRGRCL